MRFLVFAPLVARWSPLLRWDCLGYAFKPSGDAVAGLRDGEL